jgi:peptidyl-prolyl cis-trans isomerase C
MRKHTAAILLLVLTAGLIVLAGCGRESGDQVVARIGHVNITESELRQKLAELPPFTRQQFQGPEGTIDFLERLVDEEVLFQAAERAGYAESPEVQKALEAIKRRSMIQAFYREEIEATVEVDEDDVVAYYEEHDEQFQRRGRVKFRHIMSASRSAAAAARDRVLGGEDFASVARDVSTDTATREAGGLMSSIHIGDELQKVGMDKEFIENLFVWKVGEVSEPLRSNNGWHIVRLEEKVDPGTKPLDEVRDQIVQSLKPAEVRQRYEDVLGELKERYNAEINESVFRSRPRTEEELFTLAQDTDDPLQRLNFYSELVFNYPEGEHAAEAQFMIGFIHAEELENYEAARNAFERVMAEYPDSDLVESAQWMIENMGQETPPFDETGAPAGGE